MKSTVIFISALFLLFVTACNTEKKEKESFTYEQPNTANTNTSTQKNDAPKPSETVDLSTRGVGPVTEVVLPAAIDTEMASRGQANFNRLCTACHAIDQRLLGPAVKGVTKKRTPEWIMNMVINPQKMALEDPLAKALLEEYKQAIMPNQGVTETQAREILEYFRQLDRK